MWRWFALMVLLFVWTVAAVVVGAKQASADPIDESIGLRVVEPKNQRMCVSAELKINLPCAFVIQLLMKQGGGNYFCTIHNCPMKVSHAAQETQDLK